MAGFCRMRGLSKNQNLSEIFVISLFKNLSLRSPVEPRCGPSSRRQIFEQELTEIAKKMVFNPEIGIK
jgi:hypothetical protein